MEAVQINFPLGVIPPEFPEVEMLIAYTTILLASSYVLLCCSSNLSEAIEDTKRSNVEVEPGGGGPRSLSSYPIEAAVSPTTTTRGHQDHLGTNIGLGGVRSSVVLRGSALSGSHKFVFCIFSF